MESKNYTEKQEKLCLEVAIYATLLIEKLDELEKQRFYAQGLKHKGNLFMKELDKILTKTFNITELPKEGTDFLVKVTKNIEDAIDKTL